jgi:hypothetical protein
MTGENKMKRKIDAQAYHEAGHVFIARSMLEKIPITEVYYDGMEGYTKPAWTAGDINFEKLCFFIAGEIAEYRFAEDFSERNSGADRKDAENILFLLADDYATQHAIWLHAIRTVNKLIDKPENAGKIEKIAAALMKKASLSESEVDALIEN